MSADMDLIKCLLSHKCAEDLCGNSVHSLGRRLADSLDQHQIELLIDPFRYGEDYAIKMRSLDFDALLLLISPASLKSAAVQVELKTARRIGAPIFTALLEGAIPHQFSRRRSWKLQRLDDATLRNQIPALADAIRIRVTVNKQIKMVVDTNPPDVTQDAAERIYEVVDRSVLAEFARDLAKRYRETNDPTTCYFIALALGKACTPEAAKLLRGLPTKNHPYPIEGVTQALEMIAAGC